MPPPIKGKPKCLIIFGEYSETNEVLNAVTAFSILGCEVRLISPDYKKDEKIILSSHYYPEYNMTKQPLRATHIYTAINSKLAGVTHDFDKSGYKECDILFLPGGTGPDYLQNDDRVINIIKNFMERKNTIIAAVCNGVKLLTGILKN